MAKEVHILRLIAVGVSDKQKKSPERRLPADEAEVLDIAGAETDEQTALAVAQARLIGDID